jgi:hypothetical protein
MNTSWGNRKGGGGYMRQFMQAGSPVLLHFECVINDLLMLLQVHPLALQSQSCDWVDAAST